MSTVLPKYPFGSRDHGDAADHPGQPRDGYDVSTRDTNGGSDPERGQQLLQR
jgi:hypothetical protein